VSYYYNPAIRTVGEDTSLWEAMDILGKSEARALPVVDGEGRYRSLLHYSSFAQKVLRVANPRQKTVIQTSVDLLVSVLRAQAVVTRDAQAVRKSPIVIAAAEFDTFKEHLAAHIPGNAIVISGNRADVQRHAIESGVRALVITNGNLIDRPLRELAEEKGVSVLISPYDTASTSLLLIYSMPVVGVSNAEVKPVNRNDPVWKVAPLLATARAGAYRSSTTPGSSSG
jgi:manganese-dependent inorganic pyrophosphatase